MVMSPAEKGWRVHWYSDFSLIHHRFICQTLLFTIDSVHELIEKAAH
jgi:hypothetical protein